jgi:hypothetical protein
MRRITLDALLKVAALALIASIVAQTIYLMATGR